MKKPGANTPRPFLLPARMLEQVGNMARREAGDPVFAGIPIAGGQFMLQRKYAFVVSFYALVLSFFLLIAGCSSGRISATTPGSPTGPGGGGSGGGSGSGSGSKAVQVSFATTTYQSDNFLFDYSFRFPQGTALADLNGDGRDDIISSGVCSTETSGGAFAVRLSTGDGTWGAPACYTIPTAPLFPEDYAVGDFWGNGHLDVAVEDERGSISIWKNSGDGTLTQVSTLAAPGGQSGMAAADVNHDGKIDLVFCTPDPTGNGGTLNVFFGNGDGTFTAGPSTTVTAQEQFFGIATGDFDGDGNVDVVVSDISAEETEILYGDGAGKFTPGPNLGGRPSGTGNTTLIRYEAFAVTSNGRIDLIGSPLTQPPSCGTGCYPPPPTGNNYLDLELSESNRTLTSVKVPLMNCTTTDAPPQVADFDGDGIPDIIVAEGPCPGAASGSNTLDFLKENGDGAFQAEQVVSTTSDEINEWFVLKDSQSGKPGLAVVQSQVVGNAVTNPEELILVNTTP